MLFQTYSLRVTEAIQIAGEVRLQYFRAELWNFYFEENRHYVVSLDHSRTPAANFAASGPLDWSLTLMTEGRILHFEIVTDASKGPVLRALALVGRRPKGPGCRILLAIDNMAHSGDTAYLTELITALGAEAATQDLFHVIAKSNEGLLGTHNWSTTGRVCPIF